MACSVQQLVIQYKLVQFYATVAQIMQMRTKT